MHSVDDENLKPRKPIDGQSPTENLQNLSAHEESIADMSFKEIKERALERVSVIQDKLNLSRTIYPSSESELPKHEKVSPVQQQELNFPESPIGSLSEWKATNIELRLELLSSPNIFLKDVELTSAEELPDVERRSDVNKLFTSALDFYSTGDAQGPYCTIGDPFVLNATLYSASDGSFVGALINIRLEGGISKEVESQHFASEAEAAAANVETRPDSIYWDAQVYFDYNQDVLKQESLCYAGD